MQVGNYRYENRTKMKKTLILKTTNGPNSLLILKHFYYKYSFI